MSTASGGLPAPFVGAPVAQAVDPVLARTGLQTTRPGFDDVMDGIEARRAVASAASASTRMSTTDEAAAVAAQRAFAAFAATHAGWYIINIFNEAFVNWYAVPAVRVLEFVPARSNSVVDMAVARAIADLRVRVLAAREDIMAMPIVWEANIPFLIPHSEASLHASGHVNAKRGRALARAATFARLRNTEFERRKSAADAAAPVTAPVITEFQMWKEYRDTPKTFDFESKEDTAPAATVLRRVLAKQRARLDEWAASIVAETTAAAASVKSSPSVPHARLPALDADDEDDSAAPPAVPTTPPAPERAAPIPAPAASSTTQAAPSASAPPLPTSILKEVPSKWLTPAAAAAHIEHELPADIRPRGFMAASFIIDLDTPAESSEFPAAAGMEPVCILWGGVYDNYEDAAAVIEASIAPIAIDFPVDVVKPGHIMYPSEMDEDAVEVKHRPENQGMQSTLQQVMDARTSGIAQVRAAAAYNGSGGNIATTVIQDNAHSLPSLDDVVVNPIRIDKIVQGIDATSAPDTIEAQVFRAAAAGEAATFVSNTKK